MKCELSAEPIFVQIVQQGFWIWQTRPGVDQVNVDEKEHCQDSLEQEETLQQPPQLLWHCSRIGKREPKRSSRLQIFVKGIALPEE